MRKEEITFYSQIIWKNLYDADRQILISNIFEKFMIDKGPNFFFSSLVKKIFEAAVRLSHKAKSW